MTITAKIHSVNKITGRIKTDSGGGQADSDHYTISVGGYEFVSVAVETIETESEEEE